MQLRIIGEIRDGLASANVQWWLFGGWAVDFHLGRVTRDHGDIEFYFWRNDAEALATALRRIGFVPVEIPYADEALEFLKDGQKICPVMLMRREDDAIVVPGRWLHWPFLDGVFSGVIASIEDVQAPVMTIESLLDGRLRYQEHAPGAPPLRERDIVAIQQLRSIVESQSISDG